MSTLRDAVLWVAALALGLVGWTGPAQAEPTANHPIVFSDDISDHSTTVIADDDSDSDSDSGSDKDDSDSDSADSDTD
ncbi:MAG: hypothetical protein V3T14_07735 [Myxococcota bacterium]